MGLPAGTLAWTGPFDPAADEDWRVFQAGGMTERDYWARRCAEFHELTGEPAEMPAFMVHLYDGSEDEIVRPGATRLIADAKAAGLPVGALTNDLTAFHDQSWIDRMSVIDSFDVLVDGRRDGVMKPDPAAYLLVAERLGVTPQECVFIDDQPGNLAGAEAVGMLPVYLDPVDPEPAFQEARRLLGLD
ncbi:MAG: HAD-IA family hydrolase [Candidatus Nanopelagicales bacterium]